MKISARRKLFVTCEAVRHSVAWLAARGEDVSVEAALFSDPLREFRSPRAAAAADSADAASAPEDGWRSSDVAEPPFSLSLRLEDDRRTILRSLSWGRFYESVSVEKFGRNVCKIERLIMGKGYN
jgi:hypothetical protein